MSRTTGILVVIFCSLLLAVLSGPMASAQQPPNDFCAGALPITGEVNELFLTFGATTDSSLFDVGVCGFDRIFNDVWYCYTATATGTCVVSTCQNAFFDTRIAVFNGCSCPADPSNVVSCNDNCPADTVNGTSTATFDATAGSQYLICIGSASPVQFGEGSFTVSCATPCVPVVVDFDADPVGGVWTAPRTVDFEANPIGTAPFTYLWSFGELPGIPDNTSTVQKPSHTYMTPGLYSVSLDVTDGCDPPNVVAAPFFEIEITPCVQPVAAFRFSQIDFDTVAFTNQSTGSPTLTYQWNFGDPNSEILNPGANTSTFVDPFHTFSANQMAYTVWLTVTSTDPDSDWVCPPGTESEVFHSVFVTNTIPGNQPFWRGDSNQDNKVDLADVIHLLFHLFNGGHSNCRKAADVNDDAQVDVADPIYMLTYLFGGGSPPPAPFGECGPDPSDDNLTCVSFDVCD